MEVGSVRVGEVGAPEDGFIRYYAGEGNGEVSVTGSVRVGGGGACPDLYIEIVS